MGSSRIRGARARTGEQDAIATATLALTHPGGRPLVEAYDAALAVGVGSTMRA